MTLEVFERFSRAAKHGDKVEIVYANGIKVKGLYRDEGLDNSIHISSGFCEDRVDTLILVKSIESIKLLKESKVYF